MTIEANEESVENLQYLTFNTDGHDYAIPIHHMKEIVPYKGSTTIPLAPAAISGLINLRGRAISVLDLSIRFGGQETGMTKRTCVLIVDLRDERDGCDMGILADSIRRVIDVEASDLEETPSFGLGAATEYLMGMLRTDDGFIPIIDIEKVLNPEGLLEAEFSKLTAEKGSENDALDNDAGETSERDDSITATENPEQTQGSIDE